MPEVVKGFESIPAYELIKFHVIQRLMNLSDVAARMQIMKSMNKSDPMTEHQFRSDTLNFYQLLRPKIIDYVRRRREQEYKEFIDNMDWFLMNFRKFSTKDAIIAFNNLNQFCEEYKLTSTTMWTGTAQRLGTDVYNV